MTTLSSSGSDSITIDFPAGFDAVIVDEACQATEVSTLIPIRLTKKCILIGGIKKIQLYYKFRSEPTPADRFIDGSSGEKIE